MEANDDDCVVWLSRVFLLLSHQSGQKKRRREQACLKILRKSVGNMKKIESRLVLRFQLLIRILGKADGSVDMVLGAFCSAVVRVFMFAPLA